MNRIDKAFVREEAGHYLRSAARYLRENYPDSSHPIPYTRDGWAVRRAIQILESLQRIVVWGKDEQA